MKFRTLSVIILSLFFHFSGKTQQTGLLEQMKDEEQEAVKAIALYPEKERLAILEASAHPEILVRMQRIRSTTEASFQDVLATLPEDEQKRLYNISRYPYLIAAICKGNKKKSGDELETILTDYPVEVHDDAILLNQKQFQLLVTVNDLYAQSQESFEELIGNYPEKTQQAYRQLVALPEIISTLNNNMGITVLLGDIYKHDPEKLKQELDSLNVVVAEEKAKELNEWKQSLEDDPEAMAEYEQASQEFAEDQGYNATDYQSNPTTTQVTNVYINQVWQPYPYWFGSPWWYPYECWYPYPWWYHWGYYYGPGNVIVFVGMPSDYYVYWHWYHYHHFYHYPHFTNHMMTYYYGHRSSVNSVTTGTAHWLSENRGELPQNWLVDDGHRVDRIKEYGKFRMDYQNVVQQASNGAPTQREYLQQNAKAYPSLAPVLGEKENPVYGEPKAQNKYVPPTREYKTPAPQPKVRVEENPSNPQKIDRARTYHDNVWQKNKQQPKQQMPTPQPRQTPPPQKSVPVPQQQKNVPVKKQPAGGNVRVKK